MTVSEYIRDMFLTCPHIEQIPISIDYLSDTPTEAAIEAVAVPKPVKIYTDGSKVMRYQFILSLRLPWFNQDGGMGSGIIENVCDWVEEISEKGLPSMSEVGEKLTPIKLVPYPSRYDVNGKNSSARYQAVFELYYLKTK